MTAGREHFLASLIWKEMKDEDHGAEITLWRKWLGGTLDNSYTPLWSGMSRKSNRPSPNGWCDQLLQDNIRTGGLVVMEMILTKYNNRKTLHMLHDEGENLYRSLEVTKISLARAVINKTDGIRYQHGLLGDKIVKNEADWLKDPDKILLIIVRSSIRPWYPLTDKMRTGGWSDTSSSWERPRCRSCGLCSCHAWRLAGANIYERMLRDPSQDLLGPS